MDEMPEIKAPFKSQVQLEVESKAYTDLIGKLEDESKQLETWLIHIGQGLEQHQPAKLKIVEDSFANQLEAAQYNKNSMRRILDQSEAQLSKLKQNKDHIVERLSVRHELMKAATGKSDVMSSDELVRADRVISLQEDTVKINRSNVDLAEAKRLDAARALQNWNAQDHQAEREALIEKHNEGKHKKELLDYKIKEAKRLLRVTSLWNQYMKYAIKNLYKPDFADPIKLANDCNWHYNERLLEVHWFDVDCYGEGTCQGWQYGNNKCDCGAQYFAINYEDLKEETDILIFDIKDKTPSGWPVSCR
jgi:hypothetical protein